MEIGIDEAKAVVLHLMEATAREVTLLNNVRHEVDLLRNEMILARDYVESINVGGNQRKRNYVDQFRELIHEGEDTIERYVVYVDRRAEDNFFKKFIRYINIFSKRKVGVQIRQINTDLEEFRQKEEQFQAARSQEPSVSDQQIIIKTTQPVALEDNVDVVDFEDEASEIIKELKGNGELRFIPILGMSGIGKTTLAVKVFKDSAVAAGGFKHRACVAVSKNPVKQVLLNLLQQLSSLTDEVDKNSEPELKEKLVVVLRGSKYLIVLDDVWDLELKNNYFPDDNLGSRIIVTTQHDSVARELSPTNYDRHKLELIRDPNKSFKLLCINVFGRSGVCPSYLRPKGLEIASKCEGLRLSIVVISGVLRTIERTISSWQHVSKAITDNVLDRDREKKDGDKIFAMSYDMLPEYLRPCFRYFGNFPEASEIKTRNLVSLWVAEGYPRETNWVAPEQVAQKYLRDLIDRNLVLVVDRKFDGGIKSCRMHDLLWKFSLSKAVEKKELEVSGQHNIQPCCNSRRLAIHYSTLAYISGNRSRSNLRSLLCFGLDNEKIFLREWKRLYKYDLIRILDLWGVDVDVIPSGIKRLICLKYLRVKSSSAESLPAAISKLKNLQFLQVRAPLTKKPNLNVWKMSNLRHFYFNGEALIMKPTSKTHAAHRLQTLSTISPKSCTEEVLSKVPNLIKLGICGDLENHREAAFSNLVLLKELTKLKLVRDRRYPSMSVLQGFIFPEKLAKLTLLHTELSVDPMVELGKLSTLQVLKLLDTSCSEISLNCTGEGFVGLLVLKLKNIPITSWDVSDESMKNLKKVVINGCEKLVNLPKSLAARSNLEELHIWWPNTDVLDWARVIARDSQNQKFTFHLNGEPQQKQAEASTSGKQKEASTSGKQEEASTSG